MNDHCCHGKQASMQCSRHSPIHLAVCLSPLPNISMIQIPLHCAWQLSMRRILCAGLRACLQRALFCSRAAYTALCWRTRRNSELSHQSAALHSWPAGSPLLSNFSCSHSKICQIRLSSAAQHLILIRSSTNRIGVAHV